MPKFRITMSAVQIRDVKKSHEYEKKSKKKNRPRYFDVYTIVLVKVLVDGWKLSIVYRLVADKSWVTVACRRWSVSSYAGTCLYPQRLTIGFGDGGQTVSSYGQFCLSAVQPHVDRVSYYRCNVAVVLYMSQTYRLTLAKDKFNRPIMDNGGGPKHD